MKANRKRLQVTSAMIGIQQQQHCQKRVFDCVVACEDVSIPGSNVSISGSIRNVPVCGFRFFHMYSLWDYSISRDDKCRVLARRLPPPPPPTEEEEDGVV